LFSEAFQVCEASGPLMNCLLRTAAGLSLWFIRFECKEYFYIYCCFHCDGDSVHI